MTGDKATNNLSTLCQKMVVVSLCSFALFFCYSVNLANASLLALTGFAIFTNSFRDKVARLKKNKLLLILPAYFLLLVIGLLYSDDLKYGWRILERTIFLFLLPLFLGSAEFDLRKTARYAVPIFVTSVILACVYCLVSNVLYFYKQDLSFALFLDWEYTYENLSKRFLSLHPTYFSMAIIMAIILVVALSLSQLLNKIASLLLVTFLTIFLFILGSKISIVTLILLANGAFLFYIWKQWKRGARKILLYYVCFNTFVITLGLNTPVVYWRFRVGLENIRDTLSGKTTNDYRVLHWKCGCEAVRRSSLFGFGTADAQVVMDECYKKYELNHLLGYNAHNLYLDSWIKVGIVGFLLAFILIFVPYFVSVRNGHYLFTAIFFVFVMISFVESIFSVQKGITLFGVLATLYLTSPAGMKNLLVKKWTE
jgi:O-antigen ligase